MRRVKKWLAGALAVLLLVNLLPASALAEEENAGEEPAVEQVETLGEEDTPQTEESPADSEPDTDVGTADPGDLGGSTRQDGTVADIVVTGDVAAVGNYLGFAAAVADDAVKSIRITGSVVIPAASTAMDAGSKGITVCGSGSLTLAPGAVLTSSAPMGQFSYEDDEHTWTHIAEGMDVFLLWRDENNNVHRELYGTQPDEDALNTLLNKTGHGSLNTAVFRDDVTLTAGNATIRTLFMMGKKTALTIQDKASLTIEGYLHVEDGSLHVLPGGSLAFGAEGEGWVNGDVELRNGQAPGPLNWAGNGLWPHLVALEYDYDSKDPTALRRGDFRSDLWMTPLDEPEVVFGFLYFDETANDWRFNLDITGDLSFGGLQYQQRKDQSQRWYLSGAEWNKTYTITYRVDEQTAYTLPVYSRLPELGYYSAPVATEANYINRFEYTPGNDTFYLCVDPDARFLQEEGVTLGKPMLIQGDSGKITCEPAVDENGDNIPNVWKITVSGGEFWAEYQVDILRNGQRDGDIRCGIEIREGMYPHLVALDYDNSENAASPTAVRTEYYHNAYWITPTYEPALVFAFLHEENGRWTFDTDITVTIRDTTTEDGACGLTYEQREDRDGRMVLSGAEWDHTYEVSYTAEDGVTYTLPVHVVLPTAGYYKAPAVTKEAFINHWAYIPNSENEFYLCVDPNEWFMREEGITLADPELVRGDPERVSCQAVEGKTGFWKITVTGCDFDIEYELRAFRGEEEVYRDRCGLWIEMGKYPHLVALDYDYESDEPLAVRTDHYNDALSITPVDEPELVFAFMYEEDGQWKFDTNIAVDAGGLTYEARNDRKGRMVLSGAKWDRTYNISYTAADNTVYTLPVYSQLPDLGFYSAPEVSREAYINRWGYTPLSRNEFYLCAKPDTWFMRDSEVSLGELELRNANSSQVSVEPVRKGVWKITVFDFDFSADFELPFFRNGNKEGSMGRGIWIDTGEQLVWSTQLLTKEPGDVDFDPENMQLSNTLTLYPDSSQDVALYLLVYYRPDEQNGHGKWVCEYTGREWVRGEGVTVGGAEDSPLCRVTANAVGAHSIVRLDGEEVTTEDKKVEYQPIPGSARGLPLTVIVEERDLPVKIDWNARTARLTNRMNEAIAVQMILAAYDADGRMCGVRAKEALSLGAGESLELAADIPQGVEVAKLKVFALDPETRKPLRQAAEKQSFPTDDQLKLLDTAEGMGLLRYLPQEDLKDLGDMTRLEMAKLIAAFCGLEVTPTAVSSFSDCGSLTNRERGIIDAVVQAKLILGFGDNTFRPEGVLTRAAAAKILYRALGEPQTAWNNEFSDVDGTNPFQEPINNLYNLGVLTGTSANDFSPSDAADKEAALTWLVRGKNFQSAHNAVPAVTGAYFVRTNAALKLKVDAPADMSKIADFRLEFMDSNGVWMEYGGFRGGIPIFGDGLNGTYTRLRITSIPKDYSANTEGVFEMSCSLTVNNRQLNAPDSVAFSKVVSGSSTIGYSAQVHGLTLDADQVVVELSAEDNGNGNRDQMAGNRFFNQNTAAGTQDVEITISDSYPTELLPDGYYRVLEIVSASVDNASTASLTVNTRGGWTKVPVLGTITGSVTPVPAATGFAFQKTPAALRLQIHTPADMSNIECFRVEFRDTNGNWVDCGTCGGSKPILGDRMNGTYDRVRITSIPGNNVTYMENAVELPCTLTVTNQMSGAPDSVAFSKVVSGSSTNGYSAQVRGLTLAADQVVVELAAEDNGYGRRSQMAGNRFRNVTATSKDVEITLYEDYPTELLPDGYYRVLEIVSASVDNASTASLTVNTRGGWEKVPALGTITDSRASVPAVTGFAFENRSVALRLRMQLPADMSNIDRFRVEFRDTNGNWVDCGTCGGSSMPIQGDRMNGTYDRVRITSVPVDDSQYQPGVYEDDCVLTIVNVSDEALSDVAFYSISNATPEPGYNVQVRGLEPDTKQVVVQLADRSNGDGSREELGGDNFFDENGTKGVTCTSFGSYLAYYFPGHYYRVLEVKDASVTDASTAYLKVKTRGGWSQITLAGSLTYGPVSNLHFRMRNYPELTWDVPADQPAGACYRTYLSSDSGQTWQQMGVTTEWNFLVPFIYEQGTYNKAKVVTVVNGREVAETTADISLTITKGAALSAASLKLEALAGGGYDCQVTGLTAETPFTLYFKNAADTDDDVVGTERSDQNGAYRDTLRINSRVAERYFMQEYSNCAVSSDGMTASFTVADRGGWQPVTML